MTSILKVPKAEFKFGQRVRVWWSEAECQPTEGTVTGINWNPHMDKCPGYTITEDDGTQTDLIDESMLSAVNAPIPRSEIRFTPTPGYKDIPFPVPTKEQIVELLHS